MIRAAIGFFTGGSFTRLVATLLVGVAVGGVAAWRVQTWRHDSAELARQQDRESLNKRQVRTMDSASAGYEGDRATARTKFRTITKEVDRVVEKLVYRDMCFDADGLLLIERAIGSAPGAGEPSGSVPPSGEPE